ncbi:MAG: DUF2283 domain-containing protein [Nanoarchaeota archaeon]|nr:DUF2283 domain-containing protein [Nanoarchaeota archaeon]
MSYDYKHDILFFKVKDRTYKQSIELDDIIIDLDTEGYATGLQIFDAAKMFNTDKMTLRNIKTWEFSINIENGKITIALMFIMTRRNKIIVERRGQNLIREIDNKNINTEVLCTIPEKR